MGANEKQQEVINRTQGIYIVDAGAGTGKTFTITQRYQNILQKGVHPNDILLITFTRNAATHMKEKVMSKVEPQRAVEIIEAPILNFDSFCFKIVSKYGLHAPNFLGISDNLSGFKLISEKAIQKKIFNRFFNTFLERYQKTYEKVLVEVTSQYDIYSLIEQLLSKGIYPTKEGWFLEAQNKLKGNVEEYLERFNELNTPGIGKKGATNSQLLSNFNQKKEYYKFPEQEEFKQENQINPELGKIAFEDDREELLEFIHLVYYEYIKYMVRENTMTFSLISMFAFLILYEDDNVRESNSFEYVMVDEFQDTNEMQFMLILLLMKKSNLCVVGDWKQGIYGFRNATINNIRDFKEKIFQYKAQLNTNKQRVLFELGEIIPLDFDINYRSSQKILSFSEQSLVVNGSKNELSEEKISQIQEHIVSLKSEFEYDECSEIKFYQAKDRDSEIDFILQKIQELVGNKVITYYDPSTNEYREKIIDFNDIAILSRNRTFGLEIQKRALEYTIPAVYDGGVQLFEEEPAIILLAWLKLLLYVDKKEAWIPILEKEEYSYAQITYILETKEYPKELLEFRDYLLHNKKMINYIIDEIFKKYHYTDSISNAIIRVLEQIFHSTLMSMSDLIVFIEENIENKETYSIELEGNSNSLTIQTIHAAKGLEYPIVFIVNCNVSNFPNTSSNSNSITFHELVGVRTKKVFSPEHNYVFDNWKTELVNFKLFSDLDEERRLLYVAITRAMYGVYITSHKPSEFYKGLAQDKSETIDEAQIQKIELEETTNPSVLEITTSVEDIHRTFSVHDLMTFKEGQKGRGMEFGTTIHKLAFRYVKNLPISNIKEECIKDFEHVKKFVNTKLKGGKFVAEIDCALRLSQVLVKGIIDLIVEFEDRIEIVDWKTDMVKDNKEEYKKQLSVYYHVVQEVYSTKKASCKIFWTCNGEEEEIIPLSLEELETHIY